MKLMNKVRGWNKVRTTRRELESLTDRDLADIGIARSDIRWIAGQSK